MVLRRLHEKGDKRFKLGSLWHKKKEEDAPADKLVSCAQTSTGTNMKTRPAMERTGGTGTGAQQITVLGDDHTASDQIDLTGTYSPASKDEQSARGIVGDGILNLYRPISNS